MLPLEKSSNAELEGANLIHFGTFRQTQDYTATNSVALVDSYYTTMPDPEILAYRINSTREYVGWETSTARTALLGSSAQEITSAPENSFILALPQDLRNVMRQCTKYSLNDPSAGNAVTATQDWCSLPSEYEVLGETVNSSPNEANYQKQYDYYASGNSKIKYAHDETGTAAYWVTRSIVYPLTREYICTIGQNGEGIGGWAVNNSLGLSAILYV